MKQFMHEPVRKIFNMTQVLLHSLVPLQLGDCVTRAHLNDVATANTSNPCASALLGKRNASIVEVISSFEIPMDTVNISNFVRDRSDMYASM